jgi:Uncharacterized protein conserved in bacteria (DUF2332)
MAGLRPCPPGPSGRAPAACPEPGSDERARPLLNLRFDRYRYELGDERWGPAGSPLVIRSRLAGAGRPSLDAGLQIASRAGCDPRLIARAGYHGDFLEWLV